LGDLDPKVKPPTGEVDIIFWGKNDELDNLIPKKSSTYLVLLTLDPVESEFLWSS